MILNSKLNAPYFCEMSQSTHQSRFIWLRGGNWFQPQAKCARNSHPDWPFVGVPSEILLVLNIDSLNVMSHLKKGVVAQDLS